MRRCVEPIVGGVGGYSDGGLVDGGLVPSAVGIDGSLSLPPVIVERGLFLSVYCVLVNYGLGGLTMVEKSLLWLCAGCCLPKRLTGSVMLQAIINFGHVRGR